MFQTIRHTFDLMKMSWRVLMQDRELVAFPLLAGAFMLVAVGAFAGVAAMTGTLNRVDALSGETTSGEQVQAVDLVLGIALYATVSFIIIFFNAALIAAALERLRGGDPTVRSGLRVARAHIPAILGWSLISATVGLVLQMLRNQSDSLLGRIAISLVGGAWAYLTFFVVPMLVAEGLGPVEAIKRSGSLFKRTWGQQAASSFGFGLVYLLAILVAILPAALLFAVSPVLGVLVAVPTIAIAIGVVQALEGIFKAALYDFASGGTPAGFEGSTLRDAYRAL